MKVKLTLTNDKAAYLQIMEYIREQVATGDLKPDDRLPAIRTLAANLKIDPGTVARAYLELTREDVITARQGSGSYVAPVIADSGFIKQRRQRLGKIIEKSIIEALGLGFPIEEIETTATVQLAEWRERRAPSSLKKKPPNKKTREIIRFSGSHDLAVELLARHLGTLQPELHLETAFVGSLAGLMALESGEAEVAGSHLVDEQTGEFNLPFIRKLMPNESVVVINLMQRTQGLMVAKGNPKKILGVKDLTRKGITFVNRQKGSGTRILFDSRLGKANIAHSAIKGYERVETTHMAVAGLIARRKADAGMGAQSAADVSGLDFIPVFKERYDLIMLQDTLEKKPFNIIPKIVQSIEYKKMLKSIPGYDITDTGKLKIVKP